MHTSRIASPFPSRKARATALGAAAALLLAAVLVVAPPAHAAGTLTVTSTADAAVANCSTTTVAPTPLTLRAALCVANNTSGAVQVNVPSGGYHLAAGALVIGTNTGADITVTGAAGTIITGDGSHQVMTLDPNLVGGVAVTIDTVTLTGGVDNLYGGGAIIGGAAGGAADALTVKNSTISNNSASIDNGPGGGIQFTGGSLTVTGSTFSGNSSGPSNGGAIQYQAQGTGTQGLTIAGSTFSGNSSGPSNSAAAVGGGAIIVDDITGTNVPMSITNSTFSGNAANGVSANGGVGGAVYLGSGSLTITGSTFTGNSVTGGSGASGSAIAAASGSHLTAQYNRIVGNTGAAAIGDQSGAAQATLNWWGCNTGPSTSGCDAVAGIAAPAFTPWLALHAAATPTTIIAPATTSALTADLLTDSSGGAVDPAKVSALGGAHVAWTATGAGTVAPASAGFTAGSAAATFTSSGSGAATVTATLDSASLPLQLGVAAAPQFTSADAATFLVGTLGTFAVTATGFPAPAITLAGGSSLPTGLTLTDHGSGHATIDGTAQAADIGAHVVTLVASTASPVQSVQQQLTITIGVAPAFTSSAMATFTAGVAGSFSAIATGSPTPMITETGTLPGGLQFDTAVPGTLGISGTPTVGSGGAYTLHLTASNTVGQASQDLVLTVNEAPTVSSPDHVTFVSGQAATPFTFAAAGGFPAGPHISAVAGTLPSGVSAVAAAPGYVLSGTPPLGTHGVFPLVVTATNGAVSSTQNFTLTVDEVPVVTVQPQPATVVAGSTATFSAAASGFPAPSLIWQVSTDGGASFTTVPNETAAVLSVTTTQSMNGNQYRAVFHNSAGDATSAAALLTVGTPPAFTSTGSATFTVGGGAQNASVTTSGVPDATIAAAGLPGWLQLTPVGAGTAALHGAPAAGDGGLYSIGLTATNGFGIDAAQTFALTVTEAPTFTSAPTATLTAGAAANVQITTSHAYPALTGITLAGGLPAGVSYVDGLNGTATLTGTPSAASGGVYHLTLTTVGGVSTVQQQLTVTVNAAPTITSAATARFTRGVAGTFTITTGPAYPTPTVSISGTLPTGLTFTPNADGTATISGTSAVPASSVSVQVTAANGTAPDATQTLVVSVADAAVVPLPPILPIGQALSGVPAHVVPGQVLHVSGGGFAAFAPVTVGFYSTATVLLTAAADASGAFTATITIPANASGAHTILAAGVAPNGAARYLTAPTTVDVPNAGTASSTGSGAASGMANTGLPEDVPLFLIFGLVVIAAGIALRVRRRRHGA
ncbi:beta strand repeat-containing protein [Rathayibacter soli]|uniref:beta strand repeat-containing protein n=1 Tax=Rathayibacter soli TaxID=3144168 RepID=UPI0027E41982|nr:putative Ig domain-containing protein [Glaciibacter superstes]